jgi:D-serine deaminase-like pyridoxal phosphate-dependent protein
LRPARADLDKRTPAIGPRSRIARCRPWLCDWRGGDARSWLVAAARPIAQTAEKAGSTRDLLAPNGIECSIITGAGTGTFEFEAASGVYTELQCGSYIFMDADYGRDHDGTPTRAFEPSLYVWATVMSRQMIKCTALRLSLTGPACLPLPGAMRP